MISKKEAQDAKAKLQQQFPGLTLGLAKAGDDYTIAARCKDKASLPANAPTSIDGVTIEYQFTGDIKPL